MDSHPTCRVIRQLCQLQLPIIRLVYKRYKDAPGYPGFVRGWFRSVVVITLASHARGRGFDPRRNLGFKGLSQCWVTRIFGGHVWKLVLYEAVKLLLLLSA